MREDTQGKNTLRMQESHDACDLQVIYNLKPLHV